MFMLAWLEEISSFGLIKSTKPIMIATWTPRDKRRGSRFFIGSLSQTVGQKFKQWEVLWSVTLSIEKDHFRSVSKIAQLTRKYASLGILCVCQSSSVAHQFSRPTLWLLKKATEICYWQALPIACSLLFIHASSVPLNVATFVALRMNDAASSSSIGSCLSTLPSYWQCTLVKLWRRWKEMVFFGVFFYVTVRYSSPYFVADNKYVHPAKNKICFIMPCFASVCCFIRRSWLELWFDWRATTLNFHWCKIQLTNEKSPISKK